MTSPIRNTTTDPMTPYLVLLDGMDGMDGNDGSGAIEAMEKQGQAQLINSDRLPTNGNNGGKGGNDDEYLALGFTFGDPDPDDPMFRPATLPEGWKREASDHDMWSYLVDGLGRRRVSIFYKAAFYDRSAFMRLDTPSTYFYNLMYAKGEPVLDEVWLTAAVAVKELTALRDREIQDVEQAEGWIAEGKDPAYWGERVAEQRANAAWADALIQKLAAVAG